MKIRSQYKKNLNSYISKLPGSLMYCFKKVFQIINLEIDSEPMVEFCLIIFVFKSSIFLHSNSHGFPRSIIYEFRSLSKLKRLKLLIF